MTSYTISNYGTSEFVLSPGTSSLSVTSAGTIQVGTTFAAVYGASGASPPWTVVNSGLIRSTYSGGYGILLESPGTIINTGMIVDPAGNAAIEVAGGVLQNTGTITSVNGIYLEGGETLANLAGLIDGTGDSGVVVFFGAATITNAGTITGSVDGIESFAALTLTNAAGGVISGPSGQGVYVTAGAATVTNAGTIIGPDDAVEFVGAYADRLIVVPGAVFQGNVVGGTGTNTLELAAGAGVGTLTGVGVSITNFGTVLVDANASWKLDNLPGTGTATIGGGGTLAIQGSFAAGETIHFAGATGLLDLGNTAASLGTIAGFGSGAETIDLTNLTYAAGDKGTLLANNVLQITEAGGGTFDLHLKPGDNFNDLYFHLAAAAGGTAVTVNGTPCYCRGTRILTERGEIAVEDLQIGDCLITLAGAARPLRWIGRRSYAGRFAAGNQDVLPVLIRAGALADTVPRRDLHVSPLHAMYIDEMLIPAAALVNGSSIVQAEAVEQVEYFHLELDTHDVILAEGAPSETFIDDNSRLMFHNAAEFAALYPDAVPVPARYCAPRIEDGPELDRLRQRLAARAGAASSDAAPGRLQGYLDHVGRDRVCGWARDLDAPDRPVRLRILDNDVAIGQVVADRYRGDLENAGIGDGRFEFEFVVPGGLSPSTRHVIQVQRVADGLELSQSPRTLEAESAASVPPSPGAVDPRDRGRVDQATRERVYGWAQDGAEPDAPVALVVLADGVPVARVLANRHRGDLQQAGIGSGRHAFDVAFPGGLSPLRRHVIAVRRERDGTDLLNSPTVIEPAGSFDAAIEREVARAVDAVGQNGEPERVLRFLLAQIDRLRQLQSNLDGQRGARLEYRLMHRRLGPQADAVAAEALALDPGLRALVVDERVPAADRDAGSQAILSHMRALRRLGYAVSFVAAREIAPASTAVASLAAGGITLCGAPFYASVEEVLRRQTGCFDLVYLHRLTIAERYLALVREHAPQARILYSVADLHHIRLERQARIEDRPELLAASRRMRLMESVAAGSADAVITHSASEAALLRRIVPPHRVHCVGWDLPVNATPVPFAARRGVAFVAHFSHAPNFDAVHWLVEEVLPLVWQVDPGIACLLAGSDMPDSVHRLARPGVVAVGQVEDLAAAVFDQVRVTVAPLRYGAGIKGKVLNSFAAGVPCVMSEVAAEGLALAPVLQALVGRDAAALATLICRLHADEAANRQAAEAGLALIASGFTADVITSALGAAIKGPELVWGFRSCCND